MDDGCFLKKCDRKKSFFSFMKSFEKKSENEHFHDRSVVRIRPPPIFGFILTSRIPQNTSQLRGKEDPEREREREREDEREKKKEKSARCDFYYRVVDLVVAVVVSSFVFFPLRLRVVLRKRTKREDKNHDDEKSFKKRGELVVAFSRIFSPQKEKKKKGRTQVERG